MRLRLLTTLAAVVPFLWRRRTRRAALRTAPLPAELPARVEEQEQEPELRDAPAPTETREVAVMQAEGEGAQDLQWQQALQGTGGVLVALVIGLFMAYGLLLLLRTTG